ncbi:MAG: ferritin-like domain-containing protein [Actinobacteria bacterium]|nr:ferritin-like domain-containing protein [Actinomycetota bacterium]
MRFSIDEYQQIVQPVAVADLDLEHAFSDRPLTPEVLRCLRYMHDIELHTVCYLRDLLVTSAHRDPEITTFLTMWSYEELWHGEAIATVLRAHGEIAGRPRVQTLRRGRRVAEAVSPVKHMLGSAIAGPAMTAVHMTWGAVNEWTTQAGYARLSAKADHPVLTELLRRTMKQEGRHIDFYASRATRRLESDRRAQRLTRFALRRMWAPVGSDVMPPAEVEHLVGLLFGDADGRAMAERIDRRIDRLPGLAGLHLVARAA